MNPLSILKAMAQNGLGLKGFSEAGTLGKISMGANAGLGIYGGYSDYADARDEGDSVPAAALQAVGTGLLYSINMPITALLMAKDFGGAAYDFVQAEQAQMRQESASGQIPFKNSNFFDNQMYATMRQVGMAQAQKSEYTLQQSMLGNEARYLHKE